MDTIVKLCAQGLLCFPLLMDHMEEEMKDKEKIRRVESQRRSLVQSSLWRVAQKLYVLLIQEPGLVSGIEEDVSSIHREMLYCLDSFENFVGDVTETLRDIAYDVEDFIEDLITLKSVTKRRSSRKKLEKIKVKIRTVIDRPLFCAYIETKLVEDQNIAQTVVSPVIVKVADLLAQGSLRPQVKKKARRMEDEYKLFNGFLKNVESVELDNSSKEWLEELCNVSCEAMGILNLFMINRRLDHLPGNNKGGGTLRRVVTALPKLRSQLRLGVEMDRINSRLQDLSEKTPLQILDHAQPVCPVIWPESPPDDEDEDDEKPDIISFEDDLQEIKAQLLTDHKSSFVISIAGMEGIGKTTLAKLVYENEMVAHHFPYRACASSKQPDRYFLKDILKQMDPNKSIPGLWKEEEESSMERAKARDLWIEKMQAREEQEEEFWSIFHALLKDNKCLIVVDDIDSLRIINKLITRFSDTVSGSRMILILEYPSLISDLPEAGAGRPSSHTATAR